MPAPSERKRVLVVDDETNVRESLRLILERNYEVAVAENGDNAIELLQNAGENGFPDIMLLDVIMPGFDGLELLEKIKGQYPRLPVIMLTANKTVKTAVQAMKIGAVDYLNKPFDVDELLMLIDTTLENGGSERPAATSNGVKPSRSNLAPIPGDFGCMVGRHPLMQELYRKIEQVAKRDTTVLVTGESGTGKELIAREIHARSDRANGPFVALNCAAIPETLIESELFGHEKGSFTHAVERRLGHFELADNGTLFLDEIGELSLPVQVKMLRFLQEQEFYRVGRSKPIRVNVRIIAATNRSLERAIQESTFRQDLYYRINVVALEVPPLRDRIEDLDCLTNFFVERLAPLYGNRAPKYCKEALEVMARYSWPGNVRELENVTESILALSSGDAIVKDDLPARIRQPQGAGSDLKQNVIDGLIPFEQAEAEFERELIMRALKKTDFVQTRAAEVLGISRRILKYKMDKLGIRDSENDH